MRESCPGLTVNTVPPGPSHRASDPVVAYDAGARRLARQHAGDRAGRDAADDPPLPRRGLLDRADRRRARANGEPRLRQELAHVRQRCGEPASRPLLSRLHARRRPATTPSPCSVRTTAAGPGPPPTTLQIHVTGVIPVVQPDGTLHLVFWSPRRGMVSMRSTDGGATPRPAGDDRGVRIPERPSVPLAAARGCRRRCGRRRRRRLAGLPLQRGLLGQRRRALALCGRGGVVVTRARDLRPERRHADASESSRGPAGSRSSYYVIRPDGIDAELVTSADGARWSAPQRLNPRRMQSRVDAGDDARAHAGRLHRRQLGTRPAARRSMRSPRRRGTASCGRRSTPPARLTDGRVEAPRNSLLRRRLRAARAAPRAASPGRDVEQDLPAVGASPRRRCSWTRTRICS